MAPPRGNPLSIPIRQSAQRAERVARTPAFDRLARLGWGVKGVLYGLIGGLAFLAAAGEGGEATDAQGAIAEIAGFPFGTALLWVVAVGLVGYGLWRLFEAALDPEDHGSDAKGLVARGGYLASGSFYLFLAATLGWRLAQGGQPSGEGDATGALRPVLDHPAGPWLVGLAALVGVGAGLYQLYQAYDAPFLERWRTGEMEPVVRRAGAGVARFGLAARGVAFAVVGVLLGRAARTADAAEAGGLGDALRELSARPAVLGVIALGFIAYGLFCEVNARYRRMT